MERRGLTTRERVNGILWRVFGGWRVGLDGAAATGGRALKGRLPRGICRGVGSAVRPFSGLHWAAGVALQAGMLQC